MRDDRGAGSILVIMELAMLLVFVVGASAIGQVIVLHTKVSAAADLAALAAARAGDCGQAGRIAEANSATLQSCVQDAGDFQVVTAIEFALLGQRVPVTATARAGY